MTYCSQQALLEHKREVAAENDERRRELAEEFGTAVGDREFATGQLYVVPPTATGGVEPPVPPRKLPKKDEDVEN